MTDKLITTNIDSGVLYVLLERRYWPSRILVFQVSFVVDAQGGSRRWKAMTRNVLQASSGRESLLANCEERRRCSGSYSVSPGS